MRISVAHFVIRKVIFCVFLVLHQNNIFLKTIQSMIFALCPLIVSLIIFDITNKKGMQFVYNVRVNYV